MDVEFVRKQKAFHANSLINPDNGKKLMYGKKPYLKAVRKYGLPDLTDLVNQIDINVIRIMIQYMNDETVFSFLLINRYMIQQIPFYKFNIFQYKLKREIGHSKPKIANNTGLEIGVRITDGIYNYKVVDIYNNDVRCIKVNLIGKRMDDKFYWLKGTWQIDEQYRNTGANERYRRTINGDDITNGIIICDGGPIITDINSLYIKYASSEFDISSDPKIGTLVLVKEYIDYQEYIIEEISNDKMRLCRGNIKLDHHKINTKWVYKYTDYKKIVKIRGYK